MAQRFLETRAESAASSSIAEHDSRSHASRLAAADDEEGATTQQPLCMGDHVFKWCSVVGVSTYQHHAIVMEVLDDSVNGKQRIKVADWTLDGHGRSGVVGTSLTFPSKLTSGLGKLFRVASAQRGNSNNKHGRVRIYDTDAEGWYKVEYNVGFWKSLFASSGSCSQMSSFHPEIVRARAQFLYDHQHLIPSYHILQSNCECVALWCKSGTWCTSQIMSLLSQVARHQMASALCWVAEASAAVVTVPAAGVWGWLGYTSQVSLASTQPLLLPAIAAYGIATVGVPAVTFAVAQRCWKKTTTTLNKAFWQAHRSAASNRTSS